MKPVAKINPDASEEPHLMDAPEGMDIDSLEPGMVYQVPALVANIDGELAVLGFAGTMYNQDSVVSADMEGGEMEDEMEDEMEGESEDEYAAADMGFLDSVRKRLM